MVALLIAGTMALALLGSLGSADDRGPTAGYKSDYIIYRDGELIGVKNGSSERTVYRNADMAEVLKWMNARMTTGTVVINPGTYMMYDPWGYYMTGKVDFRLIGYGATIKQQYAGEVKRVFSIATGTADVMIAGITFDQDRSNPSHLTNESFGIQFICKVGNGARNVTFVDCRFINGNEVGIVTDSGVSDIRFQRCTVDNMGEHPVYLRGEKLFFENCTFTNYGKTYRGFMKLASVSDSVWVNCTVSPNQSRQGLSASPGGGASYGWVVIDGTNNLIRDSRFEQMNGGYSFCGAIMAIGGSGLTFDGCTFTAEDRYAAPINFQDDSQATMVNCVISDIAYIDKGPRVFMDNTVTNLEYMRIYQPGSLIANNYFDCEWNNRTNYLIQAGASNMYGVKIINNQFYRVNGYGISLVNAPGALVQGNLFANGVESGWIAPGEAMSVIDNEFRYVENKSRNALLLSNYPSQKSICLMGNSFEEGLICRFDPANVIYIS